MAAEPKTDVTWHTSPGYYVMSILVRTVCILNWMHLSRPGRFSMKFSCPLLIFLLSATPAFLRGFMQYSILLLDTDGSYVKGNLYCALLLGHNHNSFDCMMPVPLLIVVCNAVKFRFYEPWCNKLMVLLSSETYAFRWAPLHWSVPFLFSVATPFTQLEPFAQRYIAPFLTGLLASKLAKTAAVRTGQL